MVDSRQFCSVLDRDTAKIVAYNLQRLAHQKGATVICATTHNDLTADLPPTVHVHKRFGKEITIQYAPNAAATQGSLTRQIQTAEGSYTDYKQLSQLNTNELAIVLQKLSFLNQTKTYLNWKKPEN